MSFPLNPGRYHISSRIRDRPVGRSQREDRSLLPKRILVLSDPGQISGQTIFEFRPTPRPDEFQLKSAGADVGVIDGKLFAFLVDPGRPVAFRFTRLSHLGEHDYVIERPEDRTGWVASEENDTQIELRTLIVGPSDPPHVPPTQVFRIVPVD